MKKEIAQTWTVKSYCRSSERYSFRQYHIYMDGSINVPIKPFTNKLSNDIFRFFIDKLIDAYKNPVKYDLTNDWQLNTLVYNNKILRVEKQYFCDVFNGIINSFKRSKKLSKALGVHSKKHTFQQMVLKRSISEVACDLDCYCSGFEHEDNIEYMDIKIKL